MLTSIAAVPASTSRSPQLSVTIYSPNQSGPEPRIPGQAARVGQPPPLSSHTTPMASEATSRRPSASANEGTDELRRPVPLRRDDVLVLDEASCRADRLGELFLCRHCAMRLRLVLAAQG
jgi:hypothetical protein